MLLLTRCTKNPLAQQGSVILNDITAGAGGSIHDAGTGILRLMELARSSDGSGRARGIMELAMSIDSEHSAKVSSAEGSILDA
jgi:hypothetical protein